MQGELLVDPKGKPVTLKGCNLGNWFVNEFWMFGMPGVDPDQFDFEAKLTERFGEAKKDQIMDRFKSSWMTERDWKNIRRFGFNVVRVPMNYRMFEDDAKPMSLRPNAFKWIDHAVNEAEKHGMYVILDMHGIQGGQSVYDHTGRRNQNKVWTDLSNQDRAAWLWEKIAARYRSRGAVVAYDLYNEPYGGTKDQQVALFKHLYPSVRKADPAKLIFAHGNYDDFTHYGDPKKNGWRNVGFQMHYYPGLFGFGSPVPKVHAEHLERMESIESQQNAVNVPFLVGEFNVVFDAAGGAGMMRRYYDAFARYNWIGTMWSYKVLSADGGTKDSWGMVANRDKSRRIDPAKSSFEEMMDWAGSFATEPLVINESLRQMLTAKNPRLDPLPILPPVLRDAPGDAALPGWTSVDLGGARRGGLVIKDDGFDLYGSGNDIWGERDSCRFLAQTMAGDFSIEVRLDSLMDTDSYAKAGLMIRASDEPNAPFVLLSSFPSGELQLATRASAGASAVGRESTKDWKFGNRLRLVRAGDTVRAEFESGAGWKTLGQATFSGANPRVGVVALSHKDDRLTRVAYRQLRISPGP
jgi:regulation of enolase protein 1 (concanavalin A-like superfamily)